ncbi:MAG: fumarate hydratase C-terminal domain-containing protein [Gemmatimonadales bacterium]|nr:fumarate hydratase C-terminal domain-containing protein [Gemmatimonadales bacterium]
MLLEAPFTEKKIRALRVGDKVEITGLIYTGRDAVHKYLHDGGKSPVDLTDSIIYHCGPVVVKEKGKWVVKAAGPTTSIREEPYQGPLMEKFKIRAVIGKGGMGPKTLEYCQKVGAVYFHAIGGAAQVLAERVIEVPDVHMAEEFGSPEAIWEFRVERFPVVVTMDSHGKSLHEKVLAESTKNLSKLLG